MENHGPWDAAHADPVAGTLPAQWQGRDDAAAVGRWLRHLQSTDAMIPPLRDAIEASGDRGWLVFYGDHQPSLAGPFAAPGAGDRRTDYAIWSQAGGADPVERDIAAEQLPALLLERIGAR
jgi:hypothetical protein